MELNDIIMGALSATSVANGALALSPQNVSSSTVNQAGSAIQTKIPDKDKIILEEDVAIFKHVARGMCYSPEGEILLSRYIIM